jgi:hypothetical protein
LSMMKLRNSERGSWKTCRWRWAWTWRDGLQAREAPRALRFGDLVHQALAAYRPPGRKFGPDPAATFERLYMDQAAQMRDEGFNVWSDDKWADALDLGRGMLRNYVTTFQDADAQWEVLSSEQTFQRVIRVPTKELVTPVHAAVGGSVATIRIPAFSFKIVGTLDGVWRHIKSGHIVFKEYKTATAISEDGLAMDEQPTVYWTYGPKWLVTRGMLSQAEADALREILYTFLRKAIPNDDRPVNGDGLYLNKPSKEALVNRLNERRPRPGQVYAKLKVDDLMDVLRKLGEHPELLGEVSKVQPAPYFHRVPVRRDATDRRRLHERLLEEAREVWMARHGMMPLYKNPGPLHNPNCRGCAVREACEIHEAGGDYQSVLNATTTRWAPYSAHELAERI